VRKSIGLTDTEITEDTLFDGQLYCLQHRHGYRFSIDPVLLAHFVRLGTAERVLDLGAGCGVIGLILLHRHVESIKELIALELQKGLVRLIHKNSRVNHFNDRMRIVEGDLREIKKYVEPESCSAVVCNPPFYQEDSGRRSSDRESEIARHQVACDLDDVLIAAAVSVKNRGKVYLIYPAESLGILLGRAANSQLIPKRLQLVYSYPDESMAAKVFLLEAVKNGGAGMEVLPPLYIYECKNGPYTQPLQAFYRSNSF